MNRDMAFVVLYWTYTFATWRCLKTGWTHTHTYTHTHTQKEGAREKESVSERETERERDALSSQSTCAHDVARGAKAQLQQPCVLWRVYPILNSQPLQLLSLHRAQPLCSPHVALHLTRRTQQCNKPHEHRYRYTHEREREREREREIARRIYSRSEQVRMMPALATLASRAADT